MAKGKKPKKIIGKDGNAFVTATARVPVQLHTDAIRAMAGKGLSFQSVFVDALERVVREDSVIDISPASIVDQGVARSIQSASSIQSATIDVDLAVKVLNFLRSGSDDGWRPIGATIIELAKKGKH